MKLPYKDSNKQHAILIFVGQPGISGSCPGTYDQVKNKITSPNYPYNYNDNQRCNWTIEAPYGKVVVLTFESFALENHSSCDYDSLEAFDGSTPNSRSLIGKLCGSNLPS